MLVREDFHDEWTSTFWQLSGTWLLCAAVGLSGAAGIAMLVRRLCVAWALGLARHSRSPLGGDATWQALAIDGQWRRALRLLREMEEAGVELTLEVYNQVLSAMAKDKQVDKALGMLSTMRERTPLARGPGP